MNLKIVHVRRLLVILAVACIVTSASLPLSHEATSNCPASGVPVTTSLTLNSDCVYGFNQPGIVLGANSITLNCANHKVIGAVSGSGSADGIAVSNHFKVTIENCNEEEFNTGFYIYESPFTTLTGNTATDNTATSNGGDGFHIDLSFNSHLSGNTATMNSNAGFYLSDSVGTSLSSNTATGNVFGFYMTSSKYPNTQMTLTTNKADSNSNDGYYDNTFGTGTVQLGNTYSSNECNGNSAYGSYDGYAGFGPAGLCTPQG